MSGSVLAGDRGLSLPALRETAFRSARAAVKGLRVLGLGEQADEAGADDDGRPERD